MQGTIVCEPTVSTDWGEEEQKARGGQEIARSPRASRHVTMLFDYRSAGRRGVADPPIQRST